MTEKQAPSPIDELFRKTFENLPDAPDASGWDTPSEKVWKNVQANIQKPRSGWGVQSIIALGALALILAAGLYWMLSKPNDEPTDPNTNQTIEQPSTLPSDVETTTGTVEDQPISEPKSSTGKPKENNGTAKPPSTNEGQSTEKPGGNAAQPLPGSKTSLPPNSTEAQKRKAAEQGHDN